MYFVFHFQIGNYIFIKLCSFSLVLLFQFLSVPVCSGSSWLSLITFSGVIVHGICFVMVSTWSDCLLQLTIKWHFCVLEMMTWWLIACLFAESIHVTAADFTTGLLGWVVSPQHVSHRRCCLQSSAKLVSTREISASLLELRLLKKICIYANNLVYYAHDMTKVHKLFSPVATVYYF